MEVNPNDESKPEPNAPLTKEQILEEMGRRDKAFEDALKAAEEWADKYGLSFSIDPAYGMGGTFIGKGTEVTRSEDDDWESSSFGWQASSQSC